MSGILKDRDILKSILRETAIIMLESEEIDENFGNKEACDSSVPTYVGKVIVNHVVISSKVNLCYWQDWN